MVRAIFPFYNFFAKYVRSKLKPRILCVDSDSSITQQSSLFRKLSKKYSIYTSGSLSISNISPYKYDIVLFNNHNFWPGVSCKLDFEQVILLIGSNDCRISHPATNDSDENKIRSAGTLICETQHAFDFYSKIHPRVFLFNKLEITNAGKNYYSNTLHELNFIHAIDDAFRYSRRPKFRNDDVSAENNLPQLKKYCEVFQKHQFSQVHGVLLRGKSSEVYFFNGQEVAYEGYNSISKLPNSKIRSLSSGWNFESRTDIIEFLMSSRDEIAFHGLFHTDHGTMSFDELRSEMSEGLALLRRLFPTKPIRYFIAPFNRTCEATYNVAAELGLRVLASEGVHLESNLMNLKLQNRTWYRYHHHRFYPESKFPHFKLSLNALDAALARQNLS